ncbi:MAG: ABC transporter substrate-binding protein [Acetobacteraceae bacterium]
MKRFARLFAASLTAALLASTAMAESVVKVGVSQRDLGAADPAFGIGNGDEFPMRQIFNVLVGPKNGTTDLRLQNLQGELAETWEMAPDARSFTFHLRKGVQWHRGYGEFTADDVAFTIQRMKDPKTGTAYGSNFRDITAVETTDPYTVTIRLASPNPFYYAFALAPRFGGYMVSKKAVTELGDKYRHNPVGTGPFQFDSLEPKQKVVLRAFDQHWEGRPKVDRLEVLYLPETAARTLAFVKGDVDMIEGATVPGWQASVVKQQPNTVLDLGRPGSIWAFHLNMTRKPLDDIRVRKAIAHAIDQRVWTQAFGNFVSPIYGISPQGYYGSMGPEDVPKDPEWPYVYNPEKSKKLLAEAGYPNGFPIDVFVTEREEYKSNLLIIQELLRKVGIQINLRVVEHTSYHNDIRKDLNTMIMYSSGQPPLTQAVMNAFYKSSAIVGKPTRNMNFSHYGDVAGNSDALMQQANEEVDDAKRLELLKKLQIEIMWQVPSIPLPSPAGSWLHNGKTLDIGFPVKAYMGTFTLGKATSLR